MFLTGAIAVALAIALVFVIRKESDPRVVAGAIWLAVALLLLSTPALRIYSAHGMWHASMVNAIHAGGAPPENPLFAGDLLRYPYAFHWVVAQAMHWIPLAPPHWFQLLNLSALALFLWLIVRAAASMGASRGEQTAALLLCLFSANPLANAALRGSLLGADSRSIPFNKFSMINTTQLGFVVLAAILFLSLQLLRGRSKRAARIGIPLLCAAQGYLYPMLWPPALLWAGVLAIVAPELRRDWRYQLGLVASALVALPFVIAISSGKAPNASLAVGPTLSNLLEILRFAVLPCACLALAAIYSWRPRDLRISAFLLLSLGGTLGGYLLADGPDRVQYKLLAAAALPLGLLVAGPLHQLSRRPVWVVPIVAALLFHSTFVFMKRSCVSLPREPVAFSGKAILPGSPQERAMTTWIREETEPNAVFIDSTRSIPVHGMRSLFAAMDTSVDTDEYEGWTYPSSRLVLIVSGTDASHYARRISLATAVLDGSSDNATLREIASELPGRPIYVVSRNAGQRRHMNDQAGLELSQAFGWLALFELDAQPPGAAH